MSDVAQFVITGVTTGAIYALIGLGIVLVYQVTGIINFAQGHFVMVGALIFAALQESGWSVPLSAAIAVGATCAVGAATDRLAIRPAKDRSIARLIVLTIGASFAIEGIALVTVGTSPHFAEPFTGGEPLRFLGVYVLRQYVWVVVVTIITVTALWLFLTRSLPGKAMRAAAMNRDAARLVAISPSRMSLLAFVLAAALAAIGGVVLAPIEAPSATIGIALGLKGFTAAVLGGLDHAQGAIAGGLFIGVVEALAVGLLSSGYANAITFALLFVVILVRPTGLLRRTSWSRV